MTDYVTKDGRHIALVDSTPSDPTGAFLRDLWREDVSEEVWAQWDDLGEIKISPDDQGRVWRLWPIQKTTTEYVRRDPAA